MSIYSFITEWLEEVNTIEFTPNRDDVREKVFSILSERNGEIIDEMKERFLESLDETIERIVEENLDEAIEDYIESLNPEDWL